ncbi:uncharacterized protein SPPG_07538 [Spizellomyces punctatus DAOM BR117]|uniref:RNAse P Rpr2/Rpp21 subunit domain-containing protein n=1 Tax=Spizellomyces punctatus (strain DAOM BR117) TaxID=645134 RepID=A0A0L0H7F2_SPIPD|nr:uncharacterized protein SPPG_07538 [Spizellomyces punctatus DAOM BR117]KNC97147.1 hypothetical protein SPPG_07538 [Spizellomyces punctatus DAOM BR117]|eukprot:XP_016605187.1 hypothetical protein SPPG_07538 [Spizellomyces punctatus DAOM BR117]
MDSSLSRRLGFLHDAAHSLFATCPSLSRFYLSKFQDVCADQKVPIVERVSKRFCSRCGSLFVPGQNVRVRVTGDGNGEKHKKKKRKTGNRSSAPTRQETLSHACHVSHPGNRTRIIINHVKNSESMMGRVTSGVLPLQIPAPISGKRLRLVAESHQSNATLMNQVAYLCVICGAETRFPGTSIEHVRQFDAAKNSLNAAVKVPILPSGAKATPASECSQATTGNLSNVLESSPCGVKKKKKEKRKNDLRTLLAASKKDDAQRTGDSLNLTDFLSSL